MSARALGVAVLGAITPVGWSLLAIGVLLTIVGTASERNRLQRWASRSHFGKDRVLAYKSLSLEMWEYDTMDMDFEAVEANETKRKVNRLGASGNPPPSPSLDAPGTWG